MRDAVISDHRSRVTAARLERTRSHLLASAMRVFAEHDVGGSLIQEVIADAQVAQGTFYKHFRNNEELLLAVSDELSNELIVLIEGAAGDFVDPAKRIACGLRIYLHTAREFPLFAKFVHAAGLRVAGPNSILYEYLPAHIAAGRRTARFDDVPTETALDLIAGTALAAVARLSSGEAPADYPETVAAAILRALGVPGKQADRIAQIELPHLEPAAASLLALRARPKIRTGSP